MRKKIIVIGAGFGGLAIACRLAARGNTVQIFEKREKPGGRAYVQAIGGFYFDGGPSAITTPFLLDQLFQAAGKRRQDYFDLVLLNPFYRIFDEQKNTFDFSGNLDLTLEQIEKWNPDDKKNYLDLLGSLKPIHDKYFSAILENPVVTGSNLLKAAPDLIRFQSYRSVYEHVSRFIKNDFLRRAFSFQPLFIGGNPFEASSIYSLISYIESQWGVYYATGGTGTIINALVKLLQELGGKITLNQPVSEIVTSGKRVLGVRLADGAVEKADIVISNADAAYTYKRMIPEKYRRRFSDARLEKMRYSPSLFVIYFATKRRYNNSGIAHHNFLLGNRFGGLMDDIFNKKIIADDFSIYLNVPTITDSSIAPEGHEMFTVISPVPNLDSAVDWNRTARTYRDRIMAFLEEKYLPDLRANIVAEHHIDPIHFQFTLNSPKGAAFSFEPGLLQSILFRPQNRSEEFENLYLVGAGTHPGAGIPGVLSSASIVDKLIAENWS